MIGKKINQLATELAPESTDLTIIGDPTTGVSKKITLAQLGAIFSGAVSFYNDLASFPVSGDINVIYCAKDSQKLYLWSGSAYVEVFPSQALLDTYQLRSEKGNANGYASLDSGGKVPISQLPSSIMEYKGTWNAATNTPTLANGTGDTGDVYICNVAGTVNFGAGPITFAVGDYVIYSGTIWQRSSGAVGTVTSVAASITGDSITISGSPVTTSGTLAFAFNGTTAQYIRGNGTLETFPSLTGFVPYTGATANVDLGTHTLLAAKGIFSSSGSGDTVGITHSSGSGIALNITKGGNGEGLYINKTSGSGNAATIIGTLNATTLVKSGGTSSQFLKADGSVDSSTYLTTSAASSLYLPLAGGTMTGAIIGTTSTFANAGSGIGVEITNSSTGDGLKINHSSGRALNIASSASGFGIIINNTTASTSAPFTIQKQGSNVITLSDNGAANFAGQLTLGSTITNGTNTFTLPSATGTLALTSAIPANPVGGTGTTNYLPKFTGASTIGNSSISDNGTGRVSIGTTSFNDSFVISNSGAAGWEFSNTGSVITYNRSTAAYIPMTFEASNYILNRGNLGLGVTPSAWNTVTGFQVGRASIYGYAANDGGFQINTYYGNSSFRYIANGTAEQIRFEDGAIKFRQAPSGTAGNAISFTQAMTLNASGNLSIGNTNDTFKLDVSGTGRFTQFLYLNSASNTAGAQGLLFYNSGPNTGSRSWRLSNDQINWGDFAIQVSTTQTGSTYITPLNIASTGAATFSSSILSVSNGITSYSDSVNTTGILLSPGYDGSTITLRGTPNSIGWYHANILVGRDAPTAIYASYLAFATENKSSGTTNTATEKMRILGNGNVGIGTNNPTELLDVNGIARFRSQIYAADGTSSAPSVRFYNSNSGLFLPSGVDAIGFSVGNAERMRITSGGNVLIGITTDNGNRLEVVGIANNWALSTYASTTTSQSYGAIIRGGTNSSDVAFKVNNAANTIPYFNIRGDGNVGINTSNPGQKLTIFGGALAGNVGVMLDGGDTPTLQLYSLTNEAGIGTNSYLSKALTFKVNMTYDVMNSGTEVMRLTNGGDVLVNATSTTQGAKFYVNGIGAFGSVYVGALGTGTVYSNAGFLTNTNPSDYRLKNTITPLTYGLNEVLQLNPKTFYYNDDVTKARLKYGFIAQEVKDVMPDLVRRLGANTDYLGLENEGIFVTLVNAIKELKQELDTLKNK
jgi:hypothetical protein